MLDSRDLIQERDDLKEEILNDFNECFPQYEVETFEDILFDEEEIEIWRENWEDDLQTIEDIDDLENEVSTSEWDYGLTLIPENDFEDYCQELLEDIGDLPKNMPSYIKNNIDWAGVADDLRVDYSEVEYKGITYLYRY